MDWSTGDGVRVQTNFYISDVNLKAMRIGAMSCGGMSLKQLVGWSSGEHALNITIDKALRQRKIQLNSGPILVADLLIINSMLSE